MVRAEKPIGMTWHVPDAGFEIWEGKYDFPTGGVSDEVGRFVTERWGSKTITGYNPLESEPGLFRRFVELASQDEAAICQFASRFGSLEPGSVSLRFRNQPHALGQHVPRESYSRILAIGGTIRSGEPVNWWFTEAREMNDLNAIREAVQKQDESKLSSYFRWSSDYSSVERYWPGSFGFEVIASRKIYPERLQRFPVGALVPPARYYLQTKINRKLDVYFSRTRLLWNGTYTQLAVRIVPETLIAAMWLQLARAIEGDLNYVQCAACARWIEVSGKRSDARFCAEACRQKAHREKVKKAKQLAAEGHNAAEIARRLSAGGEAVRRWIR